MKPVLFMMIKRIEIFSGNRPRRYGLKGQLSRDFRCVY